MSEHERDAAQLFAAALELETCEREGFFAAECGDDPSLVAEVRALLESDGHVAERGFMREPAVNVGARQLARTLEDESRVGELFGHYRIVSALGEGGMGEVYLAEDTKLGRRVALKLVKGGLKTREVLRRFENERRILAALDHPNIARLLDGGTTPDGLPFFVMEHVEGVAIDTYAGAHALNLRARLELFRTVCAAVAYAHQRLVIHRDIKPSNILVTQDGTPKLLDFGIAKLLDPTQTAETPLVTATVMRAMTPEYASPEQVKGEPVTTATDIYSLGVLLYELLAGRRPYRFKSNSPDEVARVICTVEPERPSTASGRTAEAGATNGATPDRTTSEQLRRHLRGDLDNIILKALRKEPARRYASAGDLSEDIRRHLEGLPVAARKDTFAYRASKFVGRNRLAAAAAALVLLTLVGGIVATAWEAHVARGERARAERRFNDVRQMANSFMFELNDEIEKGPTQARAMLVKKALEYLDSLAQEAGDDPSLRRELATAYVKVGDIQGQPYNANLGDTAGALASYGKAQAILEALSASEPKNLDVLKSLCLAYQKTGRVQVRAGDTKAALVSGRKAVAKAELLLASAPANAEYLRLLSDGHVAVGQATYRGVWSDSVEESREALGSFRKALSIDEKLYAADPTNVENRRALIISNEYVGYVLGTIGDLTGDAQNYREAFEHFRKKREIAESLYATEPNRFRRSLADALADFASGQRRSGDPAGALETDRQALSLHEQIAAADPHNIEAQRDLANYHQGIGAVSMKAGDLNSALAHSRKALAIYETLQKLDSTSTENRIFLVTLYNQIGELLDKMKKGSEAQGDRFKALAVLENLSKTESTAQLSKEQVDRLIAVEDMDIAKEFEGVAADARTPATKRRESLRQALERYQQSLERWRAVQTQGALSSADAAKPDEVARGIARCEAVLGK
jgi:serine/threonine protein kinase